MIDLQQIKGAEESGRKAKVADFGHQVEDPQFLNALQSGVNRWIREIQKVGCEYSRSSAKTVVCGGSGAHYHQCVLNYKYSVIQSVFVE